MPLPKAQAWRIGLGALGANNLCNESFPVPDTCEYLGTAKEDSTIGVLREVLWYYYCTIFSR